MGGQDHTPPTLWAVRVPYHTPQKVGTLVSKKEFSVMCVVAVCRPPIVGPVALTTPPLATPCTAATASSRYRQMIGWRGAYANIPTHIHGETYIHGYLIDIRNRH